MNTLMSNSSGGWLDLLDSPSPKSTSSISVIIPTCGRNSLQQTLESVASQKLVSGDEVIVVADGRSDSARALCDRRWPMPVRFLVHGPTRNFGNAQRNF